ncbi:MAG TPA: nuclear transport factor 2 family protein [Candidatus Dormibacteraeota bacterium]|nr:nuclear transport factor 2 family protein [Candidatus Dormibacteraeota bacterium]
MSKLLARVVMALALLPVANAQEQAPPNPELQRQEILVLENEMARAIQLSNGTFFRRVLSDDFSGTLSHGQQVDKATFIDAVQAPGTRYESFIASDIKVRFYDEIAVVTCLWSSRAISRGRQLNSQMRVIHVYVNSSRGWKVVASHATQLPPDVEQSL